MQERILVIGANGQLGTVLCQTLRERYGANAVIATDLNTPKKGVIGIFEKLDALNPDRLLALVKKYNVTQIYHLAAILSAKGEQNPMQTWDINMKSLFNVLEIARQEKLNRVYFPSSIAAFGSHTPRQNTPQYTVLLADTMYGITKQAGENLCDYYFKKFGVDVRSLRYPGLISYQSLPGGGTTDYAVDIFYKALEGNSFECYLRPDSRLPMMYMPDAIRATIELMDAPLDQISTHTGYNLQGMSFTPAEIAAEIQKHIPSFQITYNVDPLRQGIADSWTESMDDTLARHDWGWKPEYDIAAMTSDMLLNLKKRLETRPEYDETKYL